MWSEKGIFTLTPKILENLKRLEKHFLISEKILRTLRFEKKHQVALTSEAERDVFDIYDYIAKKDTLQNAEYVLDNLGSLTLPLREAPERGHYPPELSVQGIKEFKEVAFKPYRAIYEITGNKVIVHLCVDGRRDMKTLLERRLIR